MVCKEGYKSAPGKLLGCYVYCKRVPAQSCPEAVSPGTDPEHMVRGIGKTDIVWGDVGSESLDAYGVLWADRDASREQGGLWGLGQSA